VRPPQQARQGLRAEPSQDRLRAEHVCEDVAFRWDPRLDRAGALDPEIADRPGRLRPVRCAPQRALLRVDSFQSLGGCLDGLGELLEVVRAGGCGEGQQAENREQASKGQSSIPK
jgi:hypothetical protein